MKINFELSGWCSGYILWEVDEDFSEIRNRWYDLGETTAQCIELMDLSWRSKILLSAVAGAIIQHLIDLHLSIKPDLIFSDGRMYIGELV